MKTEHTVYTAVNLQNTHLAALHEATELSWHAVQQMTAADSGQQSRSRTSTAALELRGTQIVLIVTIHHTLCSLCAT